MAHLLRHPIPQLASQPTQFEHIFKDNASSILEHFNTISQSSRKYGSYTSQDCIVGITLSVRSVSKHLYYTSSINQILGKYSKFCFRDNNALAYLRVSPLLHHIQSIQLNEQTTNGDHLLTLATINDTHHQKITKIDFAEIGNDTRTGKKDYTHFNAIFSVGDLRILFCQITYLSLPGCYYKTNMDPSVLGHILLSIDSLKRLRLHNFGMLYSVINALTDEQLHQIFKSLIILELPYNMTNKQSFIRLVRACHSLEYLDLFHCSDFGELIQRLSDKDIVTLFEKIKHLNIKDAIFFHSEDPFETLSARMGTENRLKRLLPHTKIYGTTQDDKSMSFHKIIPPMYD